MSHTPRRMSLKHILLTILIGLPLARPSAAEIPDGPITLEQCIKIALENNLNLRITNYQPRLSKLGLDGAYSSYDPRFSTGFSDGHRISKGRENPHHRQEKKTVGDKPTLADD